MEAKKHLVFIISTAFFALLCVVMVAVLTQQSLHQAAMMPLGLLAIAFIKICGCQIEIRILTQRLKTLEDRQLEHVN